MAVWAVCYLIALIVGGASARLECRFEPGERCDWHDASIDGSYRWRSSSETSESGQYCQLNATDHGGVAKLLSSPQRPTPTGYVCMKFRYRMYGSQVGTLRVLENAFAEESNTELWVKSGDQGPSWASARVTIPAGKPFQVTFKAEKSSSEHSSQITSENEIDIDEIEEESGRCKPSLNDVCGIDLTGIGCYEDVVYARTMPKLLASYRDVGKSRYLIDWSSYKSSLVTLLCDCARRAKEKGYKYFGLQFYGECWSGSGMLHYDEYGKGRRCITGDFDQSQCSGHSDVPCVGGAHMNYVYEIM